MLHTVAERFHGGKIFPFRKLSAHIVPDAVDVIICKYCYRPPAGNNLRIASAHVYNHDDAAVICANAKAVLFIKICRVPPGIYSVRAFRCQENHIHLPVFLYLLCAVLEAGFFFRGKKPCQIVNPDCRIGFQFRRKSRNKCQKRYTKCQKYCCKFPFYSHTSLPPIRYARSPLIRNVMQKMMRNHFTLCPVLHGSSPTILPVCPFMANR